MSSLSKTETRIFGVKLEDRSTRQADALLRAIEAELPGADFFTREDLLHLSTFSEVATITRYAYVCEAVNVLLARGRLLPRSRTELCLLGRARRFRAIDQHAREFESRISVLATELAQRHSDRTFSIMEIVRLWSASSDPHLAENVKRATARTVIKNLVRSGTREKAGIGRFGWAEGASL